jgi:hypothetical protein
MPELGSSNACRRSVIRARAFAVYASVLRFVHIPYISTTDGGGSMQPGDRPQLQSIKNEILSCRNGSILQNRRRFCFSIPFCTYPIHQNIRWSSIDDAAQPGDRPESQSIKLEISCRKGYE